MATDPVREQQDAAQPASLDSPSELQTLSQTQASGGVGTAKETAGTLVRQGVPNEVQAEQPLTESERECVLGGRYRLLSKLGAGAMGTVYQALDTKLDRSVAIKVLPEHSMPDSEAVARFEREVKALAKLSHANIVQAHDAGEDSGRRFLVMEHVAGSNLQSVLRQLGKLAPTLAASYVYQAALGMQHAHERGLIHRDLKPSNLLLTSGGQVKILDLGLARFLQDQIGDSTLTLEGYGMGTPDYMPPEQFHSARHVGPSSDVYSLGCTLYHLIAGQVPFPTSSMAEKYLAHERQEPTPLEELCPEVPVGLALAVRKMMAKRPEDRFQTAGEAAEALAPYVAGSSQAIQGLRATASWHGSRLGISVTPLKVQKRRRVFATSATALVALVALTLALWASGFLRGRKEPPPHDPNVLTVAQNGTGQFKTLNEALEQAKPGMIVRILDSAVYREDVSISDPIAHAGLTIDSPQGAVLEKDSPGTRGLIVIRGVPNVTIRGLRLRAAAPRQILMSAHGGAPGLLIDRMEFDQGATTQGDGIWFIGLKTGEHEPPAVVQNCTFRRLNIGVVVFGVLPDLSLTPDLCRRIVVRNCTFERTLTGFQVMGNAADVQFVGNRIIGPTENAGIQLEGLADPADVLIANNTFLKSTPAIRLSGKQISGERLELAANLILAAPQPDIVFADKSIIRLGNSPRFHDAWKSRNNWRETPENSSTKGWIPPTPEDVRQDEINHVLSRERDNEDFLRPDANSPLATGGVGGDLPAYVGAVPPKGVAEWDWQKTWASRHPKMLLTVSQKAEDGGEFRTIGEALKKVIRPNMTIRIEDSGIYRESLLISNRAVHEGLTLESPKKATLEVTEGGRFGLQIINVPRVTIRRLTIDVQANDAGGIVMAGCPSSVVASVAFRGNLAYRCMGISMEGLDPSPLDPPVIIRDCTFENLSTGVQILGRNVSAKQPIPTRGIMIRENFVRNCGVGILLMGHINDMLVAANRVTDCLIACIGIGDCDPGSGRVHIVNNTLKNNRDCFKAQGSVKGIEEIELVQNVIMSQRNPDMAYAGKDWETVRKWRIAGNWRHTKSTDATDPRAGELIDAADDHVVDELQFVSPDPTNVDSLRPVKDSPLATGGGGMDLPAYAGALPPEGVSAWDWEKTWQARNKTSQRASPKNAED